MSIYRPIFTGLAVSVATIVGYRIFRRIRIARALKDIRGPPASSWITGNLHNFFDADGLEWHEQILDEYGSALKLSGGFGERQLYLSDPAGLDALLNKEGANFEEPMSVLDTHTIIFGEAIGSSHGAIHKHQRKRLHPAFTVENIRNIQPTFHKIAHQLKEIFASRVDETSAGVEIDVFGWVGRAALEFIAQGTLGYSFNALDVNAKTHPYTEHSKRLLPGVFGLIMWLDWFHWLSRVGSKGFRRSVVNMAPFKSVRDLALVVNKLDEFAIELLDARRKALAEGDKGGTDIMSILVRYNSDPTDLFRLTDTEMLGQVNSLVFAGTDTSASSVAQSLHLLSEHLDLQSRLRAECRAAREANGGQDLDYDQLNALPLLDGFVREVLRLWGPVTERTRVALKDIVLPLQFPVIDKHGNEVNHLFIPSGMSVQCSARGVNRDPRVWGPDARELKPERWIGVPLDQVTTTRVPGVMYNLMTFFSGVRGCMGFKYAISEIKVVLFTLLEEFEFTPAEKQSKWFLSTVLAPRLEGTSPDSRAQLPLTVHRASSRK